MLLLPIINMQWQSERTHYAYKPALGVRRLFPLALLCIGSSSPVIQLNLSGELYVSPFLLLYLHPVCVCVSPSREERAPVQLIFFLFLFFVSRPFCFFFACVVVPGHPLRPPVAHNSISGGWRGGQLRQTMKNHMRLNALCILANQ